MKKIFQNGPFFGVAKNGFIKIYEVVSGKAVFKEIIQTETPLLSFKEWLKKKTERQCQCGTGCSCRTITPNWYKTFHYFVVSNGDVYEAYNKVVKSISKASAWHTDYHDWTNLLEKYVVQNN